TVGELAIGSLSCCFHTTWPVSAFNANTDPPSVAVKELASVATNKQPSATAGVLFMLPVPPLADTRNVHAGANVFAATGPRSCSSPWNRELFRSWLYCRHSPPSELAAHVGPAALAAVSRTGGAPSAMTTVIAPTVHARL